MTETTGEPFRSGVENPTPAAYRKRVTGARKNAHGDAVGFPAVGTSAGQTSWSNPANPSSSCVKNGSAYAVPIRLPK